MHKKSPPPAGHPLKDQARFLEKNLRSRDAAVRAHSIQRVRRLVHPLAKLTDDELVAAVRYTDLLNVVTQEQTGSPRWQNEAGTFQSHTTDYRTSTIVLAGDDGQAVRVSFSKLDELFKYAVHEGCPITVWGPDDVTSLEGYEHLSREQALDFLQKNKGRIEDRQTAEGWETLNTLLSLSDLGEEPDHCDDCDQSHADHECTACGSEHVISIGQTCQHRYHLVCQDEDCGAWMRPDGELIDQDCKYDTPNALQFTSGDRVEWTDPDHEHSGPGVILSIPGEEENVPVFPNTWIEVLLDTNRQVEAHASDLAMQSDDTDTEDPDGDGNTQSCPECGADCKDDPSIADHGRCRDCHSMWQHGELPWQQEQDEKETDASGRSADDIECYFKDPSFCSTDGDWTCSTCGTIYCSQHNHFTEKGHNVECNTCEMNRKAAAADVIHEFRNVAHRAAEWMYGHLATANPEETHPEGKDWEILSRFQVAIRRDDVEALIREGDEVSRWFFDVREQIEREQRDWSKDDSELYDEFNDALATAHDLYDVHML